METGEEEEVPAGIYLVPPSTSICTDGCGDCAPAQVTWGSHGAPEEQCPICIPTLIAGKSPAYRLEFPGAGTAAACSGAPVPEGDSNPVRRMPSEHRQRDSQAARFLLRTWSLTGCNEITTIGEAEIALRDT